LQKVLHCDCGFEARAKDEGDLVSQVQRHALRAHGMTLSKEHVLLLAFRAQLDESTWAHTFGAGHADETSSGGSGRRFTDERGGGTQ
jgi:Protein of unknown function (DUF1059)